MATSFASPTLRRRRRSSQRGTCRPTRSAVHAQERQRRPDPESALGSRRQRDRAIRRARAEARGAVLARTARRNRDVRHRQSRSQDRGRQVGRSRRAAGHRTVPVRSDGVLHPIRRLHLPEPDRQHLQRDGVRRPGRSGISPRAAAGHLFAARRDLPRRRIPVPMGRRCRCGPGSGASRVSTTSCAPPSPTAPTCRASRRSASAAASISATPNGSGASTCCMRSRRTTSPSSARRQPTATTCSRAEISHTKTLRNDPSGIRQFTVGVVGNNLLNEDIRNHVSYTKDCRADARRQRAGVRQREVLTPGSGRRRSPAAGPHGAACREIRARREWLTLC